MTTTIMMPAQIDAAIREMCSDAMSQAVATLAEKYKFDAEEANRFLDSADLKIVRKRGPASPRKDEKGSKKAEKKPAGDKPKRNKTGYLLYADEVRPAIKAELTAALEEGEKLKPQDVVKAIGAKWKAESDEVKEEWKSKAKTPTTSDDEADEIPDLEPEEVVVDAAPAPKAAPKAKSKKSLEDMAAVEQFAAVDANGQPKQEKDKKERKKKATKKGSDDEDSE